MSPPAPEPDAGKPAQGEPAPRQPAQGEPGPRQPPQGEPDLVGRTDQPTGPSQVLPMFPLQTVLFPYGLLPLHVFEPRYRALTQQCLATDRRFGVVLIAQGSEVGGGDARHTVGTVAWIDQAADLPDGRFAVVASGRDRLVIRQWLADDPFPRAEVTITPPDPIAPAATSVERATIAVRRAYAMRSELGHGPALPAGTRFADDLAVAAWQLCDLAPVGPADRQRLLEVEHAEDRLDLLCSLADAMADDLARLLAGG